MMRLGATEWDRRSVDDAEFNRIEYPLKWAVVQVGSVVPSLSKGDHSITRTPPHAEHSLAPPRQSTIAAESPWIPNVDGADEVAGRDQVTIG